MQKPSSFEVYIEHFLAPTLKDGEVVVIDNLGAHRPRRITELIEQKEAELVYLPSWKRWTRPSVRSVPLTLPDGSITVATRSRFNIYECRSQRGRQPTTEGIMELGATFCTSGECLIDDIVAFYGAGLLEYRCSRNPSHAEPVES